MKFTCQRCDGSGWVVTKRGAEKCRCRQMSSAQEPQTPIDGRSLSEAVKALGVLDFFPQDKAAQTIIGDALAAMCPSVESLRHVVRRACGLYRAWGKCGVPGLRQIVCSKYRPADGIESGPTDSYPEGIPSEKAPVPLGIEGPDMKRLGAGEAISRDARLDRQIRLLAQAKQMKPPRRKECPPPTNPDYKPIGLAEIARAEEELRDRRAKEMLYGRSATGE